MKKSVIYLKGLYLLFIHICRQQCQESYLWHIIFVKEFYYQIFHFLKIMKHQVVHFFVKVMLMI